MGRIADEFGNRTPTITQKDALPKVARLYELVEEMAGIVNDLQAMEVTVCLTRSGSPGDPLGLFAGLQIYLRTGASASTP